jgi:hypothetical protein
MYRTIIALFIVLASVASVTAAADSIDRQIKPVDDKYYPKEEKAQSKAIVWPVLIELRPGGAVLQKPGEPKSEVLVGRQYGEWDVVAVLAEPEPLAVLERNFDNWGLIAYIGHKGPVAGVRKAIGTLKAIRKEKTFSKKYFDRILDAKEDILAKQVLSAGNEPSYENVSGLLPPLKTYTFLGTITAKRKLAVLADGRMGHLKRSPYNKARGLENVYFDPWNYFNGDNIPSRDSVDLAGKQGLLGGYLPAVNFGFYDANKKWGWEQMGFAVESSGHSSGMDALVCLRPCGGKRIYKRVFSSDKLDDTTFYKALLQLNRRWQSFFAEGMQINLPKARVTDASRAAIIRALTTYIGLEPRYGLGHYWGRNHSTFPPTALFMSTCLLEWGLNKEAKDRLGYYLTHYVKNDGTFKYYGPAVSEYGEALALSARCARLTGDTDWLLSHLPKLDLVADRLLTELKDSRKKYAHSDLRYGLLYGSPEADTRKDKRVWFAGNIWCWRGLKEMGKLLEKVGEKRQNAVLSQRAKKLLTAAASLRKHTLSALERSIKGDGDPAFIPTYVGFDIPPFAKMTQDTLSNYTNYRYWLEMLSGGLLNDRMRDAILDYRRTHGGELLAMTRFSTNVDNWPYCHIAWGLIDAGRREHYQLGFFAHLAHHQTQGTFTAYEQVAVIGSKESDYSERSYGAHYCVPSEVVVPIMLKWMMVFEDHDNNELWLARAVPLSWFDDGFEISQAPTRWGKINLTVSPGGRTARLELPNPEAGIKIHLYAPRLTSLLVNEKSVKYSRSGDFITW